MDGVTALVCYTIFTGILPLIYAGYRVPAVLTGQKPADFWTRGNKTDDPGFITRTHHAHLNLVENLPLFAVVVLGASALGKEAVVDTLAPIVFYLRLGQTTAHLIGTTFPLVLVRANLFIIQLLLILWMAWGLL